MDSPCPRIYADHNATSPLLADLRAPVAALFDDSFANPSAAHALGQLARARLATARTRIAGFLGVPADTLVFTASATEANASAVAGHVRAAGRARRRALISAIEHPSVIENARLLARDGVTVERIPTNPSGVVDVARLRAQLGDDVALVAVMWANNETGVVQPVAEVAAVSRAAGARVHVDAVQAAGKLDISLAGSGADTLTVSAHKLGSLPGVGLLVEVGRAPAPWMPGGGQQNGRRGGSEPWHAIMALALASDEWLAHGAEFRANMQAARSAFEHTLRREGFSHTVLGHDAARLPNTTCLLVPGVRGQALLSALDLAGVAASHGAACSTGALEPSPALLAMGVDATTARSAMRLSFGPESTAAEGHEAARRLIACATRLRGAGTL